jgi:ABC-type Fe3+/spermidine/putrescine transport system ATPase subunit
VILATHQVDLAMRLSDRIAVLLDGRIAQIGTPAEVYERPATLAVARLLGPAFEMRVGDGMRIVRTHQARFETDPAGSFTVTGCHFAGGCWHVAASDGETSAVVASDAAVTIGTRGRVHIDG